MRITIELDDKLCENIKKFCKLNNMTYTEYLSKIIEEKFNVDRFGDLNEKVKKKQSPLKPIQHVETEIINNITNETKETSPGTCNEQKQANELVEPKIKKRQLKTK